jgi:hypothetical protein
LNDDTWFTICRLYSNVCYWKIQKYFIWVVETEFVTLIALFLLWKYSSSIEKRSMSVKTITDINKEFLNKNELLIFVISRKDRNIQI